MFSKTILPNGIRLILVPLKEDKTVTLMVTIGVGSRYEPVQINGVSHFIEHIMFKGTKKRPNTLAISKELDSVGAEYNAFTSKDHTGYFVKADWRKLDLALDILSDMLINSKFKNDELEREKKVIIEEINMYEDNPLMYIEDLFEQSLFDGNPLGWRISGSREAVSGITRQKMLEYKNNHYRGENTVICVAGKISNGVTKKIKKYFSKIKGTIKQEDQFLSFAFPSFVCIQKKPAVKIQYKETEQIQAILGFPGYSYFDPDLYALIVLSIILGGSMSSRLFIKIRERKGLCYFIKSNVNIYQDTGNLFIQSGLDKSRLEPALKLILEELVKIKEKGITPAELKKAKDFFSGKVAIELEDNMKLAQWYTEQELLTKEILTPEEKIDKVMAVTREDVQRAANEIIKQSNINLALIGPFKEEKNFLKILRI